MTPVGPARRNVCRGTPRAGDADIECRPSPAGESRNTVTARFRSFLVVGALGFLAIHLWWLPRALEDPDSINFALGVESFDVSKHQPHPPGYPVYIALAKASTGMVGVVRPNWDRDRRAAVGLALLGVLAGTVGLFVLAEFWLAVGLPPNLAWLSALLTVVSPLFWITASRPLTDVVGLVAALAVQTWLFRGWRLVRDGATSLPIAWTIAAFGVGLLPGLRSQTVWLIGPLGCWALGELLWRRRWSHAARFAALTVAGGLAWLVPLIVWSGGLTRYLSTLGAQGAEDFAGVEMLATTPTLDMLRFALDRTFLVPWQLPALGQVVCVLAAVGLIRMVRTGPGVVACLCLAFWPYVIFHLTFQETLYALPIVVPVAGLAVVGLAWLLRRFVVAGALTLAVAGLSLALPDARLYATEIAPLSRAVRDMMAARRTMTEPPVITMHHPLWWSSRRTLDWYRPVWNVGPQPFPGDREWLRIVSHFEQGRTNPVWLLADPSRTDLALIDPRSRVVRGAYSRKGSLQRLVGGDLLEDSSWIEYQRPGWMLGRGWALTPEVTGATVQDRAEPHRRPADGWLRRAEGAHRLMLGGRYLGGRGPAAVVIAFDGREWARWTITESSAPWVRWLELPAGSLDGQGPYGKLTVTVAAEGPGQEAPHISLEQFDFAADGALMFAFGEGWQELEQNAATGTTWRWSSAAASLEVHGGGTDAALTVSGESPLRYFDEPPTIRIVAGGEEVARWQPAADFTRTITVPARLLQAKPTLVSIETNLVWVPAERSGSLDRRQLGLRLYGVDLREP